MFVLIRLKLRFPNSHTNVIHYLRFILKFKNVCINETKITGRTAK